MYADFGCMYAEAVGCMYADVGCKVCGCCVQSMRLLCAKYAVAGCMCAETFGCMYAVVGCISDSG